jgi:hypothetical protein
MWMEWTPETLDEFESAMADADDRDEDGPGLLTIVDAGELDMDALGAALV